MDPKNPPQPSPASEPYDMFDYPKLYPRGWNLNEMQDEQPEEEDGETSEDGQPMPDSYDSFYEPRTFPSGWDLE